MGKTADQEIVWAAYLRLSRLKSRGRRPARHRGRYRNPDESVQRQLHLIREYAAGHGLNLPDHLIFCDNGRSAWRKPGGPQPERPDWDRMIKAGKAGEFSGVLTWKLERFARNIRDGEDLIDLEVLLDGPDSGRIDTRTAHGKSVVRKQFEAATHASTEASERVLAVFDDMVHSGYRVSGAGRAFGFEILSQAELDDSDYPEEEDGEAPRLTGPAAVVREAEAAVVRELARRLLDGETVQAMAADLNARGITTTRGGPWAPNNLARMLGNPLYGGHLVHRGEIVARLANVEPILDKGTYDAVQAKLGARKKGRKATGRYPLTGIAVCGNPACPKRGTMAGHQYTGGKRAYICPPATGGCGQSALAAPVELIVRDRVLTELANADGRRAMRDADAWLDEQRAKLTRQLDELDEDAAQTAKKRDQTPPSMTRLRDQYDRNLASMAARHQATEQELNALGRAPAPAEPMQLMTAEEWDDRDLTPADRKAAYIRRLGLRITIKPSERPRGSSRLPFDATRVQIDG